MEQYGSQVTSYEVNTANQLEDRWRAKGSIFTPDGKLETPEVSGKTKEEAEEKAREALISLHAAVSGKRE
jgi:hypothetical protein